MIGHVAPLLLLLLNALLLAAIVLTWVFGALSWTAPDPVPVEPSLLSSVAAESPLPPEYDRDNVLGRPLFTADRRPMPAVAAADAEPVVPPGDALSSARLLGLVGEGAAALVIIQSEGKTTRLPVGGEFGSWTLEAVDRLGADFVSASGEARRVAIQRSVAAPAASVANAASQAEPGTPQARAAERRARRDALLRQAQERSQ